MGPDSSLWCEYLDIAKVLWASLPSGDVNIILLRQNLVSRLALPFVPLPASGELFILSLDECPSPLPVSHLYVGFGSSSFSLRPSPKSFGLLGYPTRESNAMYIRLSVCRPDFVHWLSFVCSARCLVCDCPSGRRCECHAQCLRSLVRSRQCTSSASTSQVLDEPLCEPCTDPDLDDEDPVHVLQSDVQFDDLANINETTRASHSVPSGPGYPKQWLFLIHTIRSSPSKIFWEIFSGSAVLTSAFWNAGWICGPPIDILEDPSYNVLNPAFLALLIGLILEGRVALLHVAPPCSSFSWAVNRFITYAMRSLEFPEGFPNLPPHRQEKVALGNAIADVALKLCTAQEKVKGAWQWEQPEGSIMLSLPAIKEFISRLGIYQACAWVCFFGAPWAKPTAVISNHPYVMELDVRCPWWPHEHIPLVGYGPDGRNWTAIAGPYWPKFCEA